MSLQPLLNDGNVVLVDPQSDSQAQPFPDSKNTPSAVLHRSLHNDPHQVIGGQGLNLYLSNGQTILDATGGAAVSCLGHGHPRIASAITSQLSTIAYTHSLFFSTSASEELCRFLVDSTGGEMSRAYIVSSGSEAIEAALKLARQYSLETEPKQEKRVRFIARRESYHGTTLGALSVGGHVGRRGLFEPILMGKGTVSHVSACNAYRGMNDGETEEQYGERLAKELDDEFERVGGDTVCAFIAEPVVGAALGCVPPVKGYFKAVQQVCRKHGALLILDEIMSGMGRVGTLHAWQQPDIDIVPDIQTIGKALGGGYTPVAGLLINKSVVDALNSGTGAFGHGQTYQGHPIACRAALEVQREISEKNLVKNVEIQGQALGDELKEKIGNHPHVGNIRGRGLFWGIEFVQDKQTKEPFDPKLGVAMGVHEKGMDPPYNISLYPGTGTVDGKRGDHVLLSPAFNVTKEDIERIVRLTAMVIQNFFLEKFGQEE
ncbi:MAG: hypothetical protein M1820_002236 [Bogoriella megaspora]|nr:MAG: hypothetical protein M1820_002236 [Bogoriella megaspora]